MVVVFALGFYGTDFVCVVCLLVQGLQLGGYFILCDLRCGFWWRRSGYELVLGMKARVWLRVVLFLVSFLY